ncbi:unnamed protein product, partial [Ectocarpus sp. 12 AP-2014]
MSSVHNPCTKTNITQFVTNILGIKNLSLAKTGGSQVRVLSVASATASSTNHPLAQNLVFCLGTVKEEQEGTSCKTVSRRNPTAIRLDGKGQRFCVATICSRSSVCWVKRSFRYIVPTELVHAFRE